MQFTTRTFTLVVMVAGLVQAGLGKLLDASASAYMIMATTTAVIAAAGLLARIIHLVVSTDPLEDTIRRINPADISFPVDELKVVPGRRSEFSMTPQYMLLRRQLEKALTVHTKFSNVKFFLPSFSVMPLPENMHLFGLMPSQTFRSMNSLFDRLEYNVRNVGALCKMVFWMRHGAGIHNDAEAALGTQRWEESEAKKDVYFDPELSAAGRAEAQQMGKHFRAACDAGFSVDIILVSPLLRCLRTAEIAFASVWDQIPVVCIENLRERMGVHTCDRRRRVSELRQMFPHVNFDFIQNDIDLKWSPTKRETDEEVVVRALKSLAFLFTLRPTRVLVVSHSGLIQAACTAMAHPPYPCRTGELFGTVVVRTVHEPSSSSSSSAAAAAATSSAAASSSSASSSSKASMNGNGGGKRMFDAATIAKVAGSVVLEETERAAAAAAALSGGAAPRAHKSGGVGSGAAAAGYASGAAGGSKAKGASTTAPSAAAARVTSPASASGGAGGALKPTSSSSHSSSSSNNTVNIPASSLSKSSQQQAHAAATSGSGLVRRK